MDKFRRTVESMSGYLWSPVHFVVHWSRNSWIKSGMNSEHDFYPSIKRVQDGRPSASTYTSRPVISHRFAVPRLDAHQFYLMHELFATFMDWGDYWLLSHQVTAQLPPTISQYTIILPLYEFIYWHAVSCWSHRNPATNRGPAGASQ